MRFQPNLFAGATLPSATASEIKYHPMLFSASLGFAMKEGGPLLGPFLDYLDLATRTPRRTWGADWIIDTRVHMLMPGWYPCIPGWHHDDVVRSRDDGQPNYEDPEWARPCHVFAVLEATDAPTGSLTEFVVTPVQLAIPEAPGAIYGHWNRELNEMLACGDVRSATVSPNTVYEFTTHDFHRGMPATQSGWRMFIRATCGSRRPHANEIRRQVQTYLPALEEGW